MKLPLPPLLVAVGGLAQWRGLRGRPTTRASTLAGGAVGAASVGLIGAALAQLARSGTTVDAAHPVATTALVTAGPYSRSRHPVYLGLVGLLAVHPIVRRCPASAAVPLVALAILDHVQIAAEERVLVALFGPSFVDYRARVRRWWGRRAG